MMSQIRFLVRASSIQFNTTCSTTTLFVRPPLSAAASYATIRPRRDESRRRAAQQHDTVVDPNTNEVANDDDDDDGVSMDDLLKVRQLSKREQNVQQNVFDTRRLSRADDDDAHDAESVGLEQSERLQKYLARMGICSRRQAEQFILEGRVTVDESVIFELGFKIVPGVHRVCFDGVEISAPELQERLNRTKLYAFRKTRGLLCSRADPKGRPTLYDALARLGLGHLMPVARLDFNSEGLLLLTNDGNLKQYLEHPSSRVEREYMVRVRGPVTQNQLEKLRQMNVEHSSGSGVGSGVIGAEITVAKNSNTWLRITMLESAEIGIRDVLDRLRLTVSRIVRTRFGPFELTDKIPKNSATNLRIPKPLKDKCNIFFQEGMRRMEEEKTLELREQAAKREERYGNAPRRRKRATFRQKG